MFRSSTLSPFILLTLLSTACESSTLLKDLDDFCKIVTEIDKDTSITGEEKMAKIELRKAEYAHAIPVGMPDIWKRINELSGEEKYNLLRSAALKEGNRKWSCSPYKRLATTVEFERLARESLAKEKAEKEAKEKTEAVTKLADSAAAQKPKDAKPKKDEKPKKKSKKRKR